MRIFRLGLIINPFAGIGGSVALKGSDGKDVVECALYRGAVPKAIERARETILLLEVIRHRLHFVSVRGFMGGDLLKELGFECSYIDHLAPSEESTSADTRAAAKAITERGVDLLLFAGGDGTARDIYTAIGLGQPVLGIPAGVKMQSGVYANTPKAAGELVKLMVQGEILNLDDAEVRDIDEEAYRHGRLLSRYYGELRVPSDLRYLQHVKCGGLEKEELALDDIAAEIVESIDPETIYIVGTGTTTLTIKQMMGIEGSLLGVDILQGGKLIRADVAEKDILQVLNHKRPEQGVKLILTLIGGQGHLFGRGNQQLSPAVIKQIAKENIIVVATKTKLQSLEGRPIILDTGDERLDTELAGYFRIVTAYQDYVIYPAN